MQIKFQVHHRLLSTLFIILAIALFAAMPLLAQDGDTPPPHPMLGGVTGEQPVLAQLLAAIPAEAVTIEDAPMVSYIDYRALEDARGLVHPTGGQVLLDSPLADLWINTSTRIVSGPSGNYMFLWLSEMPELVGFDFFDIDQALVFSTPPVVGTFFAGEYDLDQIETTLESRDFETITYHDVTMWTRFESGRQNLAEHETGDPFGGYLGWAARIAAIPLDENRTLLANSAHDELTHAIVDTAQGNAQSLLDDNAMAALVGAVTDPAYYETPLIQAQVYHVSMVGFMPDDPLAAGDSGNDPRSEYGTLPPYWYAMLADRQDGGTEVHIIALTYTSEAAAQAAAEEMEHRLTTFAPFSTNASMVEFFNSTISSHVYSDANGLYVAVVEMRQTGPRLGERDENSGMLLAPGRPFRIWIQALYRRQFYPLMLLGTGE